MEENRGLIHLYHGEGKGKTTCAMGLALRFSHYDKKVLIVQFLKSGTSGEILELKKSPLIQTLSVESCQKFSWNMNEEEKQRVTEEHNSFLVTARERDWDLIVLDELCGVLHNQMIDAKAVVSFLEEAKGEVVITGRNPPPFLLQLADYSTEMTLLRHPYQRGVSARKGIEF